MKLVDRLASILIGGVVLTSLSFANIVVQPQAARVIAQEDANAIAEQITVRIDGLDDDGLNEDRKTKGSGVIVRRDGNIYYVITNRHVVEKDGNYQLQTVDGTQYVVDSSQIRQFGGLDLAIVQFTSNKNYRVARLGNSELLYRRQKIYVAGYALPGPIVPYRSFISAEGNILERLRTPRDGYALIYNLNIILPGMSGGPILDEEGRLIGITGLGQLDERTSRMDLIAGIPSNSFSSIVAAVVPLPNQQPPTAASSRNSNEFFCGISEGKTATLIRTSKGIKPLILWNNPEFTCELSRERCCEEVAARLQEAYQNDRLKYLRAGTIENRPAWCITFERNSACSLSNVLIFLSPGTDANSVLEKTFNRIQRVIPITGPIYL